ncbi:MAG: ribokinase [Calditrichia bacterium]
MTQPLIIVPGGLNTDIIGLGVERLLQPGELTLGGELRVGPGGKARNMAQMAAAFLGKDQVAMIGRSSKDPFGLWKIPIEALKNAGVDTSFVKIYDFHTAGNKFPGIALIPVDRQGRNQIYVLPGVNADFGIEDIEDASPLFENPQSRKVLMMALEIPLTTAQYAIDKAAKNNIKVILDPGGISHPIDELLNENIFLIKPNEHETQILTGIPVSDFQSAKNAAEKLLDKGIQNVLITHGFRGGYFFNGDIHEHFPPPSLPPGEIRDETGCGDQVTAIIAALLTEDRPIEEVVRLAILSGTLQFQRAGIQPITREDLFGFQG